MAYREIELNIFSAEDLRDVRIWGGKMSPYVVAWIHHDMKAYSHVDAKGSTCPTWNAKLMVYGREDRLVHPDEAIIYFEIHDAGSTSNRLIGSLTLPLADLPNNLAASKEPSEPVFLNLPVKRPSGREQGVLNFALKMGGLTNEPVISEPRYHEEGEEAGEYSQSPPSAFAASGCCVLPHFYRDEHIFHREDDNHHVAAH
jgi:hypothetical protein